MRPGWLEIFSAAYSRTFRVIKTVLKSGFPWYDEESSLLQFIVSLSVAAKNCEVMTDVGYRLTEQEEASLDGNANNGKIRVKNDKKLQRGSLVCNAPVLVFLIVLLVLTCLALAIILAIEKMHQTETYARIMQDNSTSSKTNGNKTPMLPCSSAPCILAASSK